MRFIDNPKRSGNRRQRLLGRVRSAVALSGLMLCAANAGAQLAPSAPAVSSGSFTVSYTGCNGCYQHWLEEKVGDAGTWRYVSQGTTSFTGKAAGKYYYRVGYFYFDLAYYSSYSAPSGSTSYGPQVLVTVGGSLPSVDSLERQLTYRYEIRRGDINADGRFDLFVNRTAGGAAGNGALERTILQQQSTGRFTSLVPTAAQTNAAKSWPLAATESELRDVNADGFVDVIVRNVAGAVGASAAMNQIVYSPGQILTQRPLGVRSVDASLKQFASNIHAYLADPNYFVNSAPLRTEIVAYYDSWCAYGYGYSDYPSSTPTCYWTPYYVTTVIPDYSVFNPSAITIWNQEASIYGNTQSRTKGLNSIESTIEQMLTVPVGGWDLGGRRAEQGSLDEPEYRRGFELFVALLGIGSANAQEAPRRANTIYLTGRRVIGWLPSTHVALEYNRSTISAYDSDSRTLGNGVLVSEKNWSGDLSHLMMTLGTASRASTTPGVYWSLLSAADTRYDDNLPYSPLPGSGGGRYNSNGYIHGIIRATGGTTSVSMARFPGGHVPVPSSAFN